MRLRLLILGLIVLSRTKADEWPMPVIREVFSPSRAYFVRVVPGKSIGDTVGFSGAPKGPYATAEFYRMEKDRSYRPTPTATVALLNPVAPVDFFVTDDGFLITLDNWHNIGYGKIVAVYAPGGKLIRAYELGDLFSKSEIESFQHSVSSIAWRRLAATYIRPGGNSFNVTVNDAGAAFIFELSGTYQYCETRGTAYLCRAANRNRSWRPFRETGRGGS